MVLTDRELFVSDVTGLIYAHLENYGNYEITLTLNNYLKFRNPNISRKEIDEIRKAVQKHMEEMSDRIAKWTNETIESSFKPI